MISFFYTRTETVVAVGHTDPFSEEDQAKLSWLVSGRPAKPERLEQVFYGPRKEMISPWSTNAVEITQNMGVLSIYRMEEFFPKKENHLFDPMLQVEYPHLDASIFTIEKTPASVLYINDIAAFNDQEGLALSHDEVAYLESLSKKLDRKLTDSEVFGFSQVNSEHCRHKIFNGTFIIDGKEKPSSLFQLIKNTTKANPNSVVSAYKDNVAFITGPRAEQFAPKRQDRPDFFEINTIDTVFSIKAETHNFPTTVEPFNGAATGAGGEIRDRMAGGKAGVPLAGTAVYMTSYSRLEENRTWEQKVQERQWLYQKPVDILIKASNGASDFGNKFGQPLIAGSVLTFEHEENNRKLGYDKVIMLAGGVGYAKIQDSLKDTPQKGDKVIVMGGDNYRIGMGGSAVSSVDTGVFDNSIELNAVQRSNPEMQKRVCNAIRALSEKKNNPIISIHDHGAGGHLNCLSELVEETGGTIDLDKLPVGDPTLSAKEIVGNESQERMGLVLEKKDVDELQRISDRERAPFYVVGEITGDHIFTFEDKKTKQKPIHLSIEDMFGNPPKTIMNDITVPADYTDIHYEIRNIKQYLEEVLQLEAVACKDWLTNKVDRSVTGKVAKQQTAGPLQLPLNNVGVMAIDYTFTKGIATSIGHAPIAGLIDPVAGAKLSIAEALTNLVWAPLEEGLKSVSLSANWMWPAKNKGEDSRLYDAVEATSEFAVALGINIPTGKDSLSMTQKYGDERVISPGTVIISAGGQVSDVRKVVSPVIQYSEPSELWYVDFSNVPFALGGSSFSQVRNQLGKTCPTVAQPHYFKNAFNAIQDLIKEGHILAGHDISAGGMVTALLEMCFANPDGGLQINLSEMVEEDFIKALFSENPAVLIQVRNQSEAKRILKEHGVSFVPVGIPMEERSVFIRKGDAEINLDIDYYRDKWYKTSYLLDKNQSGEHLAKKRFQSYKQQKVNYSFPAGFEGSIDALSGKKKPKAAIIREKGVNGDREMAYCLYLAGFDVKDVHMTDLISGRENLEDIRMIVFVGGFSNSDVLGSAKGWAGAFLYNEKAKTALDKFYARKDTLSLGVCNGCQLMVELGLVYNDKTRKPKMLHNDSHKFESSFLSVKVESSKSVMLKGLEGAELGIWVAHGEGKFSFPFDDKEKFNLAITYSYESYPGNPNGSDFDAAGIVSDDGRHLAMMPHLERSIFPWQCGYYPRAFSHHESTPWLKAFRNAKEWIRKQ